MPKTTTRRTHFQDLCCGYSEDLIAEWCCVDLKTARHYKSGTRVPGAQALKLFLLHRDGLILGPDWQGFSVRGATMWDPYGKPVTHGQLRAYQIALQMLREALRGNHELNRQVDALFHEAARFVPGSAQPTEAKPSAPVRYRRPETVRLANLKARQAADPSADDP